MTKIDALRNLMGILNQHKKNPTADNVATITNLVSPPYKGKNPNPVIPNYPESLSGLHRDEKQRVNLTGCTSGNEPTL